MDDFQLRDETSAFVVSMACWEIWVSLFPTSVFLLHSPQMFVYSKEAGLRICRLLTFWSRELGLIFHWKSRICLRCEKRYWKFRSSVAICWGRIFIVPRLMELGFDGINACPVNSEKKMYIYLETICGTSLQVVRSKEEMHVEWHSNRKDTPIITEKKQQKKSETVKNKWRHPWACF